uniref:Uncharacterized protein n=1 Tax=Lutzomyia longipalpis TaxID=7200 RepID=A0A1B0CSH9_LUTLO
MPLIGASVSVGMGGFFGVGQQHALLIESSCPLRPSELYCQPVSMLMFQMCPKNRLDSQTMGTLLMKALVMTVMASSGSSSYYELGSDGGPHDAEFLYGAESQSKRFTFIRNADGTLGLQ